MGEKVEENIAGRALSQQTVSQSRKGTGVNNDMNGCPIEVSQRATKVWQCTSMHDLYGLIPRDNTSYNWEANCASHFMSEYLIDSIHEWRSNERVFAVGRQRWVLLDFRSFLVFVILACKRYAGYIFIAKYSIDCSFMWSAENLTEKGNIKNVNVLMRIGCLETRSLQWDDGLILQ